MSDKIYRYSWTSPGVLWENYEDPATGAQGVMVLSYRLEDIYFRDLVRELVAGTNTILPNNKPDFINWPAQPPLPWTIEELTEIVATWPATDWPVENKKGK